jgi:xanthine dehydrogenase YagR molybdenum-binding subunit
MAKVDWPIAEQRSVIGKRVDRADGPVKATGAAKYSFDVNRPGMLWAKVLPSPHARAEVVSIDTAAAEKMPGVKAVWKDDAIIGKEVLYAGQIVAAIAAETEEAAAEAVHHIKVDYKPLEHQVRDADPALFQGEPAKKEAGNVDEAFGKADIVHTGYYGVPVITHCCLEPHGQVAELREGELYVWPSTQAVSGYGDRGLAEAAGVPQNKIHVDCQYMGAGFGSKFNPGKWGVISTALAKTSGRPVKLMLDRDLELAIAGNRPSGFAKIKVGATKDGKVTAFDCEVWGTAGMSGGPPDLMPYVFDQMPDQRRIVKRIQTNRGPSAAWRAPRHPQNCYLTMSAFADTAAALKMDELEFFLKNVQETKRNEFDAPKVYSEQLKLAAEMIGWKNKAHLRGEGGPGPVKRGLGLSLHTWGGQGHPSECDVTISPDGSVEAKMGSQDLGVGTRTCIAMVVAETLGLPFEAVKVQLGRNEYPKSGGSGGSTTIGGISVSSRRAATEALNEILAKVAPRLGAQPDALEAKNGVIRVAADPNKKIAWKDACAALGVAAVTKRGVNVPGDSAKANLTSAGVGGAQAAEVSVDVETGIVTLVEMVAVQDCGLVINLKLAESQVYGGLIMGITSALYEEAVYDAKTGRMLNADMEFYRLAGIKDVGKLRVHMMTSPEYEKRGVIGLGEPPVISPAAAIGNAVANACGVRVPNLPLTPDRVLAALSQKGGMA